MTIMSDYDPDVLQEYAIEAEESLGVAEDLLMGLEANPKERESVEELFRRLHTIKSSSGYFDFDITTSLAHELETLLDLLRSGRIEFSDTLANVLFRGVDSLGAILVRVRKGLSELENDDEHRRLMNDIARLIESVESGPRDLGRLLARAHELAVGNDELLAIVEELSTQLAAELPTVEELAPQKTVPQSLPSPQSTKVVPAGDSVAGDEHDKTIRVRESRLDEFLNHVGNLVSLRQVITTIEGRLPRFVTDTEMLASVRDMAATFVRESEDLQRNIMALRLVPISLAFRKLPRLVRDVAIVAEKNIRVDIRGDLIEVDKSIIPTLEGPLIHLVRNAADHGIEPVEERRRLGKPEQATIELRTEETADMLIVSVSDDGGGIDTQALLAKSIESGVVGAGETLDLQQTLNLMFTPGLSTAAKITETSGRGVGMDVVRREIEDRGGEILVTTEPGRGSKFTIKMPKSVSTMISPAVLVSVANQPFGIQLKSVHEVVSLSMHGRHRVELVPQGKVLRLRGVVLPVVDVASVLFGSSIRNENDCIAIVCQVEDTIVAMLVDAVDDALDVVVQTIDFLARRIGHFADACLLGDGSVAMLLDLGALAKKAGIERDDVEGSARQQGDRVANVRGEKSESELDGVSSSNGEGVAYLRFCVAEGTRSAVRLDRIDRLETISASCIERSQFGLGVQYDGGILRLSHLLGDELELRDPQPVIVLNQEGARRGILVEEIIDVTTYQGEGQSEGTDGEGEVIVLGGQVHEVLNVDRIFGREPSSGVASVGEG